MSEAHADEHEGHLPPGTSVTRWLTTTNHKDVGILYIVTSLFFVMAGGALALLMRVQLLQPGGTILENLAYNQAVTIHGLLMVFWFLSPFAIGFANYIVPLQIGADDLAFPRLNALSYWLYLGSGVIILTSFFQGGSFAGGWTMYAPLNHNMPAHTPTIGGTATILGLALFVISTTIGTVNFLTTIHYSRAEGMGLWNLPMFTWSILLTVWMMLFAFAALLAALLVLGFDRVIADGLGALYAAEPVTYFGAEASGSLLWAHVFWFFGHPEVYIVFFPALGVMFEVFQTFCGRRIVGRKWVILAMVLVAVQSFLVWMHHMFLTAINLEIKTLMMATTIGISLPFDLMVFAMIYTMVKGRVRFTTPFLFVLGALILFILGGITGVFLGAVVLDYEFRGTYWVVAHFHYVMASGMTALIGGIYYWFPKISGKMYSETLGKIHFATYFVGFNLLYLPMFFAWETPRRVFHYGPEHTLWHQAATVGAFVLGFSFLLLFYNLATSYRHGPDAPDNPWEYAQTAEWAIPSPPPLENWEGRASYASGVLEFVRDEPSAAPDGGTAGAHHAAGANIEPATTETDVVHAHEEAHPDHASKWPAVISLGITVLFLGLAGLFRSHEPDGADLAVLTEPNAGALAVGVGVLVVGLLGLLSVNRLLLPVAAAGAAGVVAAFGQPYTVGLYPAVTVVGLVLFLGACFEFGRESFYAPEAAIAERWPFEGVGKNKLGTWFFLASDVVVFGAFIGAHLFTRMAYGWHEWHGGTPVAPSWIPGFVNTVVLLTSSFTVILAMVYSKRGNKRGLMGALSATLVLGLLFMVIKGIEWGYEFTHGVFPWSEIYYTTYFVTTGLHGIHVLLGMFVAGFLLWRVWAHDAYLGNDEPVELFGLYWHFVDIVWVFLFPLFYLL